MVTAFKSAIRLLPTKTYVEPFAGMLATKSYHAGLVRTLLYRRGLTSPGAACGDRSDRQAPRRSRRPQRDRSRRRAERRPHQHRGRRFRRRGVRPDARPGAQRSCTSKRAPCSRAVSSRPASASPFVNNTSGYGFVEQYDARLDALIDATEVVEEIAGDFNWIEGPVWIGGADGYLLTSHPRNNYITRWNERDGLSVFTTPSGMPEPIDPLRYAEPGSNGLFLGRGGVLVADGSLRSIRVMNLADQDLHPDRRSVRGQEVQQPERLRGVAEGWVDLLHRSDLRPARRRQLAAARDGLYGRLPDRTGATTSACSASSAFPTASASRPTAPSSTTPTRCGAGWSTRSTRTACRHPTATSSRAPRCTGGDGLKIDCRRQHVGFLPRWHHHRRARRHAPGHDPHE